MKAVEGSLPSLLQGVSQQIQSERLDGQCTEQLNMLSDPVTGIRRRVGSQHMGTTDLVGSAFGQRWQSFYIDEFGMGKHVLINVDTGKWQVRENNWALVTEGDEPYFVIPRNSRIQLQTTSLAGKFYVLNPSVGLNVSVDNTGKLNPVNTGFFFVRTGAFNKNYSVSVAGKTASYTTPDGTNAGDAAKSTPEAICTELTNQLNSGGLSVARNGAYAWLQVGGTCTVTSPSGRNYLSTSNQSLVQSEQELPAQCGNMFMCAVGSNLNRLVWYKFNTDTGAWDESGAYNYCKQVSNLPRVLDFSSYRFVQMTVRRSESGDAKTNEDPHWMVEKTITGIGSYQGRLAFLSGAYVTFSAVGKPEWWHRRTVTVLDSTDRIDIASGSAANATLRQCFQFNKDLVLMGDTVQAVIPASNYALAPENATIVVTGEYLCDSAVSPVLCGPTILYTNPRSADFFAVSEMVPSQYTSSQYVSTDITAHLPRYFINRCRKMVSSPTSNMVLVLCEDQPHTVYVHEYFFAGQDKVQSAWHIWEFQDRVESVHFGSDRVWVICTRVSKDDRMQMVASCVDPRSSNLTTVGYTKPFTDTYTECAVLADNWVKVPEHFLGPQKALAANLAVTHPNGDMAGERIGYVQGSDLDPASKGKDHIKLDASFKGKVVLLGTTYKSVFAPTSPQVRDRNDRVINTSKTRLLQYILSLRQSGAFTARVVDEYSGVDMTCPYTPLFLNSPDLQPNRAMVAKVGRVRIPCRTNAGTTEVYLQSEDVYDMNITGIEFIIQHPAKRARI